MVKAPEPPGVMTEEAYIGTEDILAYGVGLLRGAEVEYDPTTPFPLLCYQRATGVVELDIKAMRRFQSPEERLVMEVELLRGQVSAVPLTIGFAIRMLFKAG
jgi:hypothetical protein